MNKHRPALFWITGRNFSIVHRFFSCKCPSTMRSLERTQGGGHWLLGRKRLLEVSSNIRTSSSVSVWIRRVIFGFIFIVDKGSFWFIFGGFDQIKRTSSTDRRSHARQHFPLRYSSLIVDQVKMSHDNLYEMLKNKDLVLLFREFLHDIAGPENLAFWFEVHNPYQFLFHISSQIQTDSVFEFRIPNRIHLRNCFLNSSI